MRTLNFLKYTLLVVAIVGLNSCKKEGCTDKNALNFSEKAKKDDGTCEFYTEAEEFLLAKSMSNGTHTVELYTEKGNFLTGYNLVSVKIKNADGSYVDNASISWAPLMHMTSMSHSCPVSAIAKKSGATYTYNGYIVFTMASNATEYWEVAVDYSINGTDYTVTDTIIVTEAPKRVIQSFKGIDNVKYILALVEPKSPIVGINDMKAVLYKMETMTSFVPVSGFKVLIDPRMPSMGNHGSPNNVNLTQGSDEFYYGKLSLTMTGYWKINLQLEDNLGVIQKGEVVSETTESSSIFFETEF